MALFQVFRGPEEGLNDVPCHNGYAYFCEDTGNFFIDIGNNDGDRVQVNAYAAQVLKASDGTEIDIDDLFLKSMTLAVEKGGTGRTTLTANALLIGDGTNPIKMVSIGENQILAGDAASGVKGIDGTGVLFRLAGSAPEFGTLPISLGGTNATSAAQARQNLDVYNKQEVDDKVNTATTKAYTTTLTVGGWLSQDSKFVYNYTNSDLKCGAAGDVPPTITYTSNLEEYSKIEKAEATRGTGIVFTIAEKPSENIGIIIVDTQ